ncbi:hypothetical protein Q5530_34165 [Saccharothrix sp. BKS2]|uniref:DUF202 domain-containing protein n=1 Tax=Saccharothrix lopnurensis TaxID=1670621 RepID=A0ABW1PEB6_9PSEU
MTSATRQRFIPSSTRLSALYLLVGVLFTALNGWRMARAGEVAVFPAIGLVAGLALVVVAVVGLATHRRSAR